MHINVDSIFERERQADAVVVEILLILQVITGRNGQMDAVRISRDIIWVKLQTSAGGNLPFVVPWVQRQVMGANTPSLPAGVEVESDVTRRAVLVNI